MVQFERPRQHAVADRTGARVGVLTLENTAVCRTDTINYPDVDKEVSGVITTLIKGIAR
jgi:hypothetical protein